MCATEALYLQRLGTENKIPDATCSAMAQESGTPEPQPVFFSVCDFSAKAVPPIAKGLDEGQYI